jgi:hypothetical protein
LEWKNLGIGSLWPLGIFCGILVHMYSISIWYSLVVCTKKSLATLAVIGHGNVNPVRYLKKRKP